MRYIWLMFLIISACANHQQSVKSDIYLTQINKTKIGTVWLKDTGKGLLFEVNLTNLSPGNHGFHVHENPDCSSGINKKGEFEYAINAGPHFDPHKTGKHLGPNANGHFGDLPYLTAQKDGTVKTKFYLKNKKVQDFKNRSLIIHEGADNYQDTPLPLGGGGKRIACGIIK